jgi:hypothetical protein
MWPDCYSIRQSRQSLKLRVSRYLRDFVEMSEGKILHAIQSPMPGS